MSSGFPVSDAWGKSELKPGIDIPILWLGHNLRNRVLFSDHKSLKQAPILISLGDAFLRPSYKARFFTEHLRETLGMQGPVMVDSGGYALLSRRSLKCDLKEIEAIYARVPADILVSLDYPPSPGDDKSVRNGLRRRTLRNLEVLRDVVCAKRLMPVVHGHSVEDLGRSCEGVKRICPNPRYIGVGGLVPLICSGGLVSGFQYVRENGMVGNRAQWIADSLRIVREFFPNSMIHVFGVGSATTAIAIFALGADSVDSMSWRRAANYGAILLPGRSERFPLLRANRAKSRPVVQGEDLSLLRACRCPVCKGISGSFRRLRALGECYKLRAVHNAWTILAEVCQLRASMRQQQTVEFLRSRVTYNHRLYQPVMERLETIESLC